MYLITKQVVLFLYYADTVDWLLSKKMNDTPEDITEYFLSVIEPIL